MIFERSLITRKSQHIEKRCWCQTTQDTEDWRQYIY